MNQFSTDHAQQLLRTQGKEAFFEYSRQYVREDSRDPDALAGLGWYYHHAGEPERDLEKAEACFLESARAGSAHGRSGLLELGCAYMHVTVTEDTLHLETIEGFPLDLEKAERIIKTCHQFGDDSLEWIIQQMYVWLGSYYCYGWDDTERSRDKALELLRLVAASDNKTIQLQYADTMAHHSIRDETEAYKYYLRSAGQGYAPAMLKLSEFVLEFGDILGSFNPDRVIKILIRTLIAWLLSFSLEILGGIPASGILAVPLPAWAGPAGQILSVSGRLLFYGTLLWALISVYRCAIPELRKTALAVELAFVALYLCSDFVSRLLTRAGMSSEHAETAVITLVAVIAIILAFIRAARLSFQWVRKAADTGDPAGIHALAERYYYGVGVKKDRAKAIRLYKTAAKKEYAPSMVMLGHAYRFGRGVEKDYDAAFRCYQEAADAGSADGQYLVGYCWENAISQKPDMDKAIEWYQKGKANGSRLAKDRLNKPLIPTLRDHARGRAPTYAEMEQLRRSHAREIRAKDQQIAILERENEKKDEQLAEARETNRSLHRDLLTAVQNTEAGVEVLKDGQKAITDAIFALNDTIRIQKNTLIAVIRQEGSYVSDKVRETFDAYCRELHRAAVQSAGLPQYETIYQRQEQKLRSKFGPFWDRLQPDSRISLISARTMFEAAPYAAGDAEFDYSGVCICATAALEAELGHYFLHRYVDYVRDQTEDLEQWPRVLTYVDRKKNRRPSTRFVMGDLNEILDASRSRGYLAGFLQTVLRDAYYDPEDPAGFLTGRRLPDGKVKDRSFTELCALIRDRYRNPSAHDTVMGREDAADCIRRITGSCTAEARLCVTESVLYWLLDMVR